MPPAATWANQTGVGGGRASTATVMTELLSRLELWWMRTGRRIRVRYWDGTARRLIRITFLFVFVFAFFEIEFHRFGREGKGRRIYRPSVSTGSLFMRAESDQ